MKHAEWSKTKQTKPELTLINYNVAYENHEGILVTHSTGPS